MKQNLFFDKIYKIDLINIFMDKAFWTFFGKICFEINRQDAYKTMDN